VWIMELCSKSIPNKRRLMNEIKTAEYCSCAALTLGFTIPKEPMQEPL
jgi:hypothetical protein